MDKIKILIFPAGEINSIELHDALASCVNVEVFGASSIERHGEYVFSNYIPGLPLITAPDFIDKFNELLVDKKIDVVFPTHDSVALFLAEHSDQIKAKIICSDKETALVCRDKSKTYQVLKGTDFLPKLFHTIDSFPVFIKPKEGQGAVGAKLIRKNKDIPQDIELEKHVICEYLPGEEYTVDCLTDKNGNLLFISPRSRKRLMAGVSVAGQTEELTPEIRQIAHAINDRLSFLGLWWFQIKKDTLGKWKLLEVSTRCAGTMALTRAKGVNLPLLSVYIAMGKEVEILPNEYKVKIDSTLIRRFHIDYDYDTVYFDFDDTLIVRGKVNLKAIWFLYQCQNAGKKVILLTKHENEILRSIEHYHIDKHLFDSIIHIAPQDKKSKYIAPHRAIFIDNSYQERKEVHLQHQIPVFDVDAIDILMDWKN